MNGRAAFALLALALCATCASATIDWCDKPKETIVFPVKACCQKPDGTCDPSIFWKKEYKKKNLWALLTDIGKCKASCHGAKPKRDKHCQCVSNCYASGGYGDPHIKCFDGSNYLLWGKDGKTYNLISERAHQLNIRLYHPTGRVEEHALYIDAVGALINDARITVHLVKGPTASMVLGINGGNVTYPGHSMERAIDLATSFTFETPSRIVIRSRDLSFGVTIEENDHLDIQVLEVAAHWSDVHGIIGQTHSKAFQLKYNYAEATIVGDMPTNEEMAQSKKQLALKGQEDDYIVSDLLNTDDKFNRFEGGAAMSTVTRKLRVEGTSKAVKVDAGVTAASAVAARGRALLHGNKPKPVFKCV